MFTPIDILSNMGGVISAQFCYVSDVKSFFKHPETHKIYVELNDGISWTNIYMGANAGVSEEISDEDAGTVFTSQLKFRYPKLSAEVSHQKTLLSARNLIIKVVTANNDTIYIGSPKFPASYSFTKLVGDTAASFAGYQGMFSAVQPHSILFASDLILKNYSLLSGGTIVLEEIYLNASNDYRIYISSSNDGSGGSGNYSYKWQICVADVWTDTVFGYQNELDFDSQDEQHISAKWRRKITDSITGEIAYSNELQLPGTLYP